jgi:hypothetical protein
MRYCRYRRCKRPFWPAKHYFYYCSWDCCVADLGANYQRDDRGHQRERDTHYDRGWHDAWRSKPLPTETMPPYIWRVLAVLVHPDRWQQESGLLSLSHQAMVWLNTHRPADMERN